MEYLIRERVDQKQVQRSLSGSARIVRYHFQFTSFLIRGFRNSTVAPGVCCWKAMRPLWGGFKVELSHINSPLARTIVRGPSEKTCIRNHSLSRVTTRDAGTTL